MSEAGGRDSNGNYTLPGSDNPVVAATLITAEAFNTTLTSVAEALTDSLSRSGDGSMDGFEFADGTKTSPTITWANEPNTGFYRKDSQDTRFSTSGLDVFRLQAAGVVQVYREAAWHSVIDAGTDQTFTGEVQFDNEVTMYGPAVDEQGADLFITGYGDPAGRIKMFNNARLSVLDIAGENYRDVIFNDDADVFTVGDVNLATDIRGSAISIDADTTLTSDSSLYFGNDGEVWMLNNTVDQDPSVPSTYRRTLAMASGGTGDTLIIGNEQSSTIIYGEGDITLESTLRIKGNIQALDNVPAYQYFLSGVTTDSWTVGDTDIDLTITGSAVTVTPQLTLTGGAHLPNNVAIQSDPIGPYPTANLLKLTTDNEVVLGPDYLTIDGTLATFSSGIGQVRLGNNTDIEWANNAGSGFIDGIKINASDKLIIGDSSIDMAVYGGSMTREITDGTQREISVLWAYEYKTGDYDLDLGDEKTILYWENGGGVDVEVTVPKDTTYNFPIGAQIKLLLEPWGGSGFSIKAVPEDIAITIFGNEEALNYNSWATLLLTKTGANTWLSEAF
tara:strand:- start:14100 stop:15779 length:1680 start_codon:yes stop_codon:yes gene_type:complete